MSRKFGFHPRQASRNSNNSPLTHLLRLLLMREMAALDSTFDLSADGVRIDLNTAVDGGNDAA